MTRDELEKIKREYQYSSDPMLCQECFNAVAEHIIVAWNERDEVTRINNNLLQQNIELLEDVTALRREIAWLREKEQP